MLLCLSDYLGYIFWKMMIFYGWKVKVMEVFLNIWDYNCFKCYGVILRYDVDNWLLSLIVDKIVFERLKKLVIVDNFYLMSCYKIICC